MKRDQRWRPSDPALLGEVGLGVVLIILFLALYWVPAGDDAAFVPAWWAWPLLAILFFSLLWLDVRRRRTRRTTALHEEIREEAEERLQEKERERR
ncbi:MAG TPA: hypothetical protein VFI96_08065 [Longimicrobiaceae bacterium]|nr:hypothetical protein [Longimicrobiaceae bacterium]